VSPREAIRELMERPPREGEVAARP